MRVNINGKEQVVEKSQVSLVEILKIANVEQLEMVSVQLNGEFVKDQDFEKTHLKEGDEVDFLYFMGGGGFR